METMLNIIVLVKSIFDPVSIQWDHRQEQLTYLSEGFNKADLHALQWACNYKEKHQAKITALLIVEENKTIPLNRLQKFPIDNCRVLTVPQGVTHPAVIAAYLSEEIKQSTYDLILSGSVSEDTRTGITPIYLARSLGIPYLTHAYALQPQTANHWLVQRKEGRGLLQTFTISMPALIAVERSVATLRYIPRFATGRKEGKVVTKRATRLAGAVLGYQRLSLMETQPVIRYLDVPAQPLAQERILQITGITQSDNTGNEAKVKSGLTPEYTNFVAKKLEQWLKE